MNINIEIEETDGYEEYELLTNYKLMEEINNNNNGITITIK